MTTSPSEPLWLTIDDVLAIHHEQIELWGGVHGVRDQTLLASAVARVQNLFHYDGERDVVALAVRLGLGIARNHPFVDGNKRSGLVAMIEFLAVNGARLDMPNDTRLGRLIEQTVAREIGEEELMSALEGYIRED